MPDVLASRSAVKTTGLANKPTAVPGLAPLLLEKRAASQRDMRLRE